MCRSRMRALQALAISTAFFSACAEALEKVGGAEDLLHSWVPMLYGRA